MVGHELRVDLMLEALAINAGLIGFGGAAFLALVDSARRSGALLSMGE